MANTVKHGKDSRIFIGDYDFSGQGRSIDLTVFQADIADATVFTSPAKVKSPGAYSAKIDHKGIFTNAVSGWDNWLHSKLGSMSGQPISVLLGQPANGDVAYHGEIIASNVRVPVKIDDVIATEATYEIHRALARGYLLDWQSGVTGNNLSGIASTNVQVGAAGANDMLQYTFHVLSVTGDSAGGYTIQVMHSSGDSVYADLTDAKHYIPATANSGYVGSSIVRQVGSTEAWLKIRTVRDNLTDGNASFVVVASKIHKSE